MRDLGKLKPPGARGLIYGYVANINDACEIARSCWDTADAATRKVSSDTIVICVIKANCLPEAVVNKILPLTEKGRKLLAEKGPYAALPIDEPIDITVVVQKMDRIVDMVTSQPEIFRDSRNALPQPFQNLGQKPSEADKAAVLLESMTIDGRSDIVEAIIEEELDLAKHFDVAMVVDENGEDDDEDGEAVMVLEDKVEPWAPSTLADNKKKLLATLKRYGGDNLEKEGEVLMDKLARAMLEKATKQTTPTGFFAKASGQ